MLGRNNDDDMFLVRCASFRVVAPSLFSSNVHLCCTLSLAALFTPRPFTAK